jgi:hypothetical protein
MYFFGTSCPEFIFHSAAHFISPGAFPKVGIRPATSPGAFPKVGIRPDTLSGAFPKVGMLYSSFFEEKQKKD